MRMLVPQLAALGLVITPGLVAAQQPSTFIMLRVSIDSSGSMLTTLLVAASLRIFRLIADIPFMN